MEADVLHKGDSNPRRYGLLLDANMEPADITDTLTVLYLRVRERYETEILDTITCTKFDAANGVYYFDWPTDLFTEDVDAGRYEMELVIVTNDGEVTEREQTVVAHVWDGQEYDPSSVYPILLKEGFGT